MNFYETVKIANNNPSEISRKPIDCDYIETSDGIKFYLVGTKHAITDIQNFIKLHQPQINLDALVIRMNMHSMVGIFIEGETKASKRICKKLNTILKSNHLYISTDFLSGVLVALEGIPSGKA